MLGGVAYAVDCSTIIRQLIAIKVNCFMVKQELLLPRRQLVQRVLRNPVMSAVVRVCRVSL
jgi:hypothetical protein